MGDWNHVNGYLIRPELQYAVEAALTLNKPLLLRGEPGTGKTGLAGLLDKFGLSQLDHGDFLLLFILIYLFRESEDDEWLIILALVLLMGL